MSEEPPISIDQRDVAQLDNYTISSEEQKRVGVLQLLVKLCAEKGIEYTVVGGYGLDGLYGHLTRDHHDIDILVGDSTAFAALLLELGFTEIEHDDFKSVWKREGMPDDFKIEFASISAIEQVVGPELIKHVVPEVNNAQIMSTSFKAPTLEGEAIFSQVVGERAKNLDWDKYHHETHKAELIRRLTQNHGN